MTKQTFSPSWKRSTQVRKQRKYAFNAPLHTRQKMFHAHLSPDLRKEYNTRNILLRSGDKVRVMRGQFAKKEAVVDRILLKRGKVFLTGIEQFKKEGAKISVAFSPSNLMIIDLELKDKKRKQKLESNTIEPSKKEQPVPTNNQKENPKK
jgi:large subunit ribosomal protein L24